MKPFLLTLLLVLPLLAEAEELPTEAHEDPRTGHKGAEYPKTLEEFQAELNRLRPDYPQFSVDEYRSWATSVEQEIIAAFEAGIAEVDEDGVHLGIVPAETAVERINVGGYGSPHTAYVKLDSCTTGPVRFDIFYRCNVRDAQCRYVATERACTFIIH